MIDQLFSTSKGIVSRINSSVPHLPCSVDLNNWNEDKKLEKVTKSTFFIG